VTLVALATGWAASKRASSELICTTERQALASVPLRVKVSVTSRMRARFSMRSM